MNAYKLDHLLNDILYEELACWLRPKLETIYGQDNWWVKGVYEKLSETQRREFKRDKSGCLSELDLQALMHVACKNFKQLHNYCEVSWDLRPPLESVRSARNALSHRKGGRPPDPEDLLLHALNTKKLLTMISTSPDKIAKADKVIYTLEDPEIGKSFEATLDDLIDGQSDKVLSQQASSTLSKIGVAHEKRPKRQINESEFDDVPEEEPQSKRASPEVVLEKDLQAGGDADPTREPYEGSNHVITAVLESCKQDAKGTWQLVLIINVEGQDRSAFLTVPDYLSDSARAAADILNIVKSRENSPSIDIKLLNVEYENGVFRFPDNLNEDSEAYPLIVIEPSYLINVTSLTSFDYCPRNYLMDRYNISKPNQTMQRGSLVHSVFEFILKHPGKREGLMEQCHEKLDKQLPELTMQGVSAKEHYDDVSPHLNALAMGLDKALDPDSFEDIYVERYMINPDLGMKGKIDALVQKINGHWQALELKTGKSWGSEPNIGHELQVWAYHLLLSQAKIGPLDPPCVIYTGNQAKRLQDGVRLQPATMVKETMFSAKKAVELINLRNELVRIDYSGELDFNINGNKCKACVRQQKALDCINLHGLGMHGGDWHSEHLDPLIDALEFPKKHNELFQKMNRALLEEFQAIRIKHGQLLQSSIESRIVQGICLEVQSSKREPEDGKLVLGFRMGKNNSEFREGDPCLISDKAGPIEGNCIEAYISRIDKKQAVVSLPQGVSKLWFEPAHLDINAPDSAFERNFAALYTLWTSTGAVGRSMEPLRKFLSGDIFSFRPNDQIPFEIGTINRNLHPEQKRAVELAKGLRDILLIQGPPGTGKTYTLALAIKALAKNGKIIAIATYTHRAAEEVLSNLVSIAPEIKVRKLGRIESASAQFEDKCLDKILERSKDDIFCSTKNEMLKNLDARQAKIKASLNEACVYIGTTHAWLSGKYDVLPTMLTNGERSIFDYVVVDEASQIITPNLVGCLRLAERWILVGDHKQLPPIVVGDTTGVLSNTLFEQIADHQNRDDSLLVQLDTQHRMPPALSDFIGHTFYNGNLHTSADIRLNRKSIGDSNHPLMKDDRCIALVNINHDEEFHIKQSLAEAKWVENTVKELLDGGLSKYDDNDKPTFGVIAPYRAQVALLRRRLENMFEGSVEAEYWNQVVSTVDRFQGDERDIIILSLCMRPGGNRIPRIYEDERRINVALSRAKIKLWIIGFIEGMEQIPALKEFKNYAESNPHACIIVSTEGKEPFGKVEVF